jgi:hypothetical protein
MTVATKIMMGSGAVESAYEIEQSIIYNSASNSQMYFDPSSNFTSETVFTFSTWVKRASTGASQRLLTAGYYTDANNQSGMSIQFHSSDVLRVNLKRVGGVTYNNQNIESAAVFRDPAAWYHILVTRNGTAIKGYVNGVEVLSGTMTANSVVGIQNTYPVMVGVSSKPTSSPIGAYESFNGNLAETHFIDGTAKATSDFGETNEDTGQWIPKEYSGSYGTNGFYLKFVSGALGTDSSGQGNTMTVANLANSDVVPDSPTNNFATMNPLVYRPANGSQGYSEGNLKYGQPTANSWGFGFTTLNVKSGKWYAEMRCVSDVTGGVTAGVSNVGHYGLQHFLGQNPQDATGQWILYMYYTANTYSRFNGSLASETYSAFNSGQILGIALNADDKELSFYVDGTLQSSLGSSGVVDISTGGSANDEWSFFANTYYGASGAMTWNFGQNSSFLGTETPTSNSDENGVGAFHTTPPSGYLALCTANLPDPAIPLPEEHFNTVLYTGNETARSITGVGFEPSFVWIKERSASGSHRLFDQPRGVNKVLQSDAATAELDRTEVTAFNADGFSLSDSVTVNQNGVTHVSWNWKGNGSGSTNTVGSLDAVVSANAAAGFSIVTYTGNGSAQSIGHGLSKDLEFLVVKNRDANASWVVQVSTTVNDYMYLNGTGGIQQSSIFGLDITRSNDGTFYYGGPNYMGANGVDYLAYCFHSIEGYSKIGFYTGNGSSEGPMVNTGFKPAWLMIKNTSNAQDWILFDNKRDPFNVTQQFLYPNLSAAEAAGGASVLDMVSNGFKLRGTTRNRNYNGDVYLFMAFADSPFKSATAH